MRSLMTDFRRAREKESLETRRSRGEVSCAECRRLKLKCDRSIPCDTCVRRGCASICPNKTLSTGQGTRFIMSDTKTLHHKLSEMSKRIRKLEDALQIAHSAINTGNHPLLSKELLKIKNGETEPMSLQSDVANEATEDWDNVLNSYGSLTLSDRGTEEYVAGANELLVSMPVNSASDKRETFRVPTELSRLSRMFPYTPLNLPVNELQTLIESNLPSYERALVLIESYLENLSWFFRSVDREQIMEDLIPAIYLRKDDNNIDGHADPHTLALILAVFACGAVTDPSLEPRNEEAETYYHLTRAALGLKSVLDGVSLLSIQAISLIGMYDLCTTTRVTPETAWKSISFSCSLAASIGLHRDPARFNLPPKLVQRRRQVFWELYTCDVWKSLGSGRPVTFHHSVVDCQLPEDKDATFDGQHVTVPGLWHVKYLYVRDIMAEFIERLGSARLLKYSKVLELDKKIRDFNPQGWEKRPPPSSTRIFDILECLLLSYMKDTTIVLLHRNFFARAMIENPMNPLQTSFAPSYSAAYDSASNLIRLVLEHFSNHSTLISRVWPFWEHTILSSVVVGSVAANSRDSELKTRAYNESVEILSLMSKITSEPIVGAGLTILLQLHEKAKNELYPEQCTKSTTINAHESLFCTTPRSTIQQPNNLHKQQLPSEPSLQVSPEVIFATYTSCSDIVEFTTFFRKSRRDNTQNDTVSSQNCSSPCAQPSSDSNLDQSREQSQITENIIENPSPFSPGSSDFSTFHGSLEGLHGSQLNGVDGSFHHDSATSSSDWGLQEPDVNVQAVGEAPSMMNSSMMSTDEPQSSTSFYQYDDNQLNHQYFSSRDDSIHMTSPSHSQQMPGWGINPPVAIPSYADSNPMYNADFDVSFDIRAAVGRSTGGSPPLLLQDIEAWAATLQLPHNYS